MQSPFYFEKIDKSSASGEFSSSSCPLRAHLQGISTHVIISRSRLARRPYFWTTAGHSSARRPASKTDGGRRAATARGILFEDAGATQSDVTSEIVLVLFLFRQEWAGRKRKNKE
jgi:hypothetical protein